MIIIRTASEAEKLIAFIECIGLNSGAKVNAIKELRRLTGCGLKEAKYFIEGVVDEEVTFWRTSCAPDLDNLPIDEPALIITDNCDGCPDCQPEGKKSFWSYFNPFNWFK